MKTAEKEEKAAIESLKQSKLNKTILETEVQPMEENGSEHVEKQIEEDKKPPPKSGWDFRFGDLPKKEDCCTDEYVCLQLEN